MLYWLVFGAYVAEFQNVDFTCFVLLGAMTADVLALGDYGVEHISVYIREAQVAAAVAEGELFVVDAE